MSDEVIKNIVRICVPIPFPLRDVNMYALTGPQGWALIDTGMGTPDARAAFTAGLERAGLRIQDLHAIVLTHHHPDHVGLSGELQEQSGAPVYMHPIDIASTQRIWAGKISERFGGVSQFFAQHGLPPTRLWYTQVAPDVMRTLIHVPPLEAFTPLADEQELDLAGETYRVLWTPGHSDGQICLFRARDGVFFAADHVLPRITPNIGLYSAQDRENPLGDYLASLARVAELPAQTILPGHGAQFSALKERCLEIIAHHEQRLEQIVALLAERPQHAYELTERLFGSRLTSDEARRMAVAEVLSHLEYLRFNKRVEQQHTSTGIILYTPLIETASKDTTDHNLTLL